MGLTVNSSLPPVIQSHIIKLEDAGFAFHLVHNRELNGWYGNLPYKGRTLLQIYLKEQDAPVITVAFAHCSVNDQFSRARGTQIVFSRLLHKLSNIWGREKLKTLLK